MRVEMFEIIHSISDSYRSSDGRPFQVQVRGAQSGHVWYGWLAFLPLDDGPVLETDRETTQPNRDALGYWASGLEPLYLDGAFERASRPQRHLRDQLLTQAAEIVDRRWSIGDPPPPA
jgi:hypothetical protein